MARRRLGDGTGALAVLEPLAGSEPRSPFAHLELGLTLAGLGQPAEAVEALRRAVSLRDDLAAATLALAEQLARLGEEPGAEHLLADSLERAPPAQRPALWLARGHVLKALGQADEAAGAYRNALAAAPGFGEAWWGLANLKSAELSAADVAALEAQLSEPGPVAMDRDCLHFALGHALEARGEPAAAFEQFALGAAMHRRLVPYDAKAANSAMRRTKALFTAKFFAARAGVGYPSNAPIFIVGLPRAGSTLVEQILASHSKVEGTGELPDLIAMADELRGGRPWPDALADVAPGHWRQLGETYLRRTASRRKLGRPRFIDKMPNNFHHIGLIHLILPQAVIIDARRHPMANGYSAFRQHFASGHAWSYDLADIGRTWRDYTELMRHFDDVLPGRVTRLIHEDLVADPEGETRRLLTACGLDFEPASLRFWETRRPVRSASAQQVRRPITRVGLEAWRACAAELAPLAAALGPTLDTWRD